MVTEIDVAFIVNIVFVNSTILYFCLVSDISR